MTASQPQPYCHRPVLTRQVLAGFAAMPQPEHLLDCTVGGAGHSSLLLAAHPHGQVTGLDQDPGACQAAALALAPFPGRWRIHNCNFASHQPPPQQRFSGILADLGVSSPQLELAERGFSLRHAGPVDMRMNQGAGETAGQLLQRLSEAELAALIRTYGEERRARSIARRLVARRPFANTTDLAAAIAGAYPPRQRHGRIHPATRTFQALRMVVNQELEALSTLLQRGPDWLLPGGIFAVISFHSLEDRLVKQAFLKDSRLERLTRKPLTAEPEEAAGNPRSRSAKLRLARRVQGAGVGGVEGSGAKDQPLRRPPPG
ncbi:MAG: 16S rRNA (cytosine(1402)-N(4))-methyltransferase RsmH [Synechococcus sp. SB0673_bin_10]|nr:16S rRNA (cytosine(1402)-N(4))-methyltransferase RsmH [Synechococcus sp. SB0667_bin_8]MYG64908.1 16S rRNA (cytosine(1402)-N(4))-methyltransferase RsmH [Synechococcus sp. SB0675_bin_7]MYI70987.1 16S rRNA (cytosine(1402)-N(4))-methyltransferase RsmH [Synechococcus sp. SB0673_bin_10]MYK85396.1 16S rRNA (cytosine(1402)-N(4))-methyltransferase RsmH [Synechococcus sp. SB0669_bin_7]